jgi:hypothetical protein
MAVRSAGLFSYVTSCFLQSCWGVDYTSQYQQLNSLLVLMLFRQALGLLRALSTGMQALYSLYASGNILKVLPQLGHGSGASIGG